MAWTLRTVLGKWKPTARCLVGCLFKFAGGAAAAADPDNELLYRCLTAGGDQTAEHLFDSLSPEDRLHAEDRFALLQPLLDQHQQLIGRLEQLATAEGGPMRSLHELTVLIEQRLPSDLQPALAQFSAGVQETLLWLAAFEQRVMQRFDRLERQPKSPYWLSIDDREDIAWLRQLYDDSRGWPAERRRQLRLGQFAGLLHHAGQHDAASVVCADAAEQAADAPTRADLLLRKMRADLERGQLDDALAALRQALTVDPACAPFPAKKYEPLRILGAGGFGTAFLCRNLYEGGEVVVKCLHADGLERKPEVIFREVPILKQLHAAHPERFLNVHYANYADAVHERWPYLVMDYFPGETLARWLSANLTADTGLAAADFCAIAGQIAEAMQAAHQRGILHRDLKPDNILVVRDDGHWTVRVVDFGLALRCDVIQQTVSRKAYGRARLGAAAAGTAHFAAPEQMGEVNHPLGAYSDVYAFGKTCCAMLFRDLEPKRRHWLALDDKLAALVERCLERQPADRHQSFEPILAALHTFKLATLRKHAARPFDQLRQSVETMLARVRKVPTAPKSKTPSSPPAAVRKPEPLPLATALPASPPAGAKPSLKWTQLTLGYATLLLLIAAVVGVVVVVVYRINQLPPTVTPAPVTDLGFKFVRVPKGTFWMGGGSLEGPPTRQVTIDNDFELADCPVTQEQWQALMGNNPSWFSGQGNSKNKVKDLAGDDLKRFPVERVSWEDAQEYLKKLNDLEKGKGWLYRLPTEAEWEYACRNAATSKEDCSFDFYFEQPTNDLSSLLANFHGGYPAGKAAKGPSLARPTKVASYAPNKLGLYDMHGNVWQWCADFYDGGPARVVRGGSWSFNGRTCRAAVRNGLSPSYRSDDLGLRLARVPSPSK